MRDRRPWNRGGFTLIELMMVAAILGLLASIAIPKFANMIVKAKEATVKGNLGGLRSAFSVYYADNEGYLPPSVTVNLILIPKYIASVPSASLPTVPRHNRGNLMENFVGSDFNGSFKSYGDSLTGSDDYPWGYSPSANNYVVVNCTHLDSTGRVWTQW